MSVSIIPSPASRCKRVHEEADLGFDGTAHLEARQQKRFRLPRQFPAVGRCASEFQAANGLQALLSLFPGMDEKVVQDVLLECGNSIDAAIKRLTGLKLNSEDASVVATSAAGTVDEGHVNTLRSPQSHNHVPQQQPAAANSQGELQTADQWINFLVSRMLPAKDMDDARGRAAGVLQDFERFVKHRQKDENDAKLAELAKENMILKRAVQIQDTRMRSVADELNQLRSLLSHYQERCTRLETNNYSLAMHLQQATSTSGLGSHPHNPDVC